MSLAERSTDLPLRHLKHWRPIKIDALGLVTLLGADDVNKSIGTLQRRRFTECLPLLAAFVIAGDNFTEEQPGYALYNITDGIYTTELKGWFTRWLSVQKIRKSTTVFHWRVLEERSPEFREFQLLAWIISILAVAPLLVCTCLIGDWYGVGNSLAIIFSIVVRKSLLWQLRERLNRVAAPQSDPKTTSQGSERLPLHKQDSEKSQTSVSTSTRQLHRKTSAPTAKDEVKLFVTRADGKMVTIYTPRSILETFTRDFELPSAEWYHFLRWVGWAAFGAHIIVLGMASLFTQIYTVILLVFSTWALCHDFDIDTGRQLDEEFETKDKLPAEAITIPFTSRVVVTKENPDIEDRRMLAYVRAKPTDDQEDMLKHWSMMPRPGVTWYEDYDAAKAQYLRDTGGQPFKGSPRPTESSDSSQASTLRSDS